MANRNQQHPNFPTNWPAMTPGVPANIPAQVDAYQQRVAEQARQIMGPNPLASQSNRRGTK